MASEKNCKLINPIWHNTLEFLAGMLDEQNAAALLKELAQKFLGTGNQVFDSTYRENLEVIIKIASESNNLFLTEGNILDYLTTQYMNFVGKYDSTWCGGDAYWRNSTLGQVLTLILNGEVPTEKKVEGLAKASFCYQCLEHFKNLSLKPRSLVPDVAPAIVEYICSEEKVNPALISELSQCIINTTQTRDLFSKALGEAPLKKKSYFLQLLGPVVNPSDLMHFIQTHSLDLLDKKYLYRLFETIGKTSVDILLQNFGSNTEDDFMILNALAKIGDARAVESLCLRLESKYSSEINLDGLLYAVERICGGDVLEEMGDTRAIEFLSRQLESKYSSEIARPTLGRIGAVDLLEEKRDIPAVESLSQQLESKSSSRITLHWLLSTLGRIGNSKATTYLVRFLDSENPYNFEAIETLIRVGDHYAFSSLCKFRERYAQKYSELKSLAEQAEQREKEKTDFGATVKLYHYEPQELYAMSFVHAYEKIPDE
ncbi:hypothetical protein HZC30_03655 [Candidatus Woesearchaeota archaeon]|nr:hypothetical protein [Candidatus Woesearchaeota archaeon]